MIPADLLAAAETLDRTGECRDVRIVRTVVTPRRTVYVGERWALKYDRGTMDAEDPRWRRTTEQEARYIADASVGGNAAHFPATQLVGTRVLVQERCDPNPALYRASACNVELLASTLGIRNVHNENVGWRNRLPVFLDHDYLGPDLTVILLLKLRTKRRALQGEAGFWQEWGPRYLERMVRNVRRHLPADTRIVCMTDQPDVVPAGVDVAELAGDQPGWWAKLNAFRRDVSCGRCLYLDLDNVIAGPIPELLALTPDPMIMMDDRQMPGMPNASTMLFFAERVRYLWDVYAADPAAAETRYDERNWPHASDQAYTTATLLEREGRYMPYFQDVVGDGYCLNSRVELEAGAPWEQARLVFGCYEPKPHTSRHPFYARHWAA